MRIVSVTGSRAKFWDGREDEIKHLVDSVIARIAERWSGDVRVISGEAPTGVDRWVAESCSRLGVEYKGYPANWRPDGVSIDMTAGHRRNEEMASIADDATAIWDGKSPGTFDMIKRCLYHRVNTQVLFP